MEASEKKVSTRVRGAAWRRKDAPKARCVSFPGRHGGVKEMKEQSEREISEGMPGKYDRGCLQEKRRTEAHMREYLWEHGRERRNMTESFGKSEAYFFSCIINMLLLHNIYLSFPFATLFLYSASDIVIQYCSPLTSSLSRLPANHRKTRRQKFLNIFYKNPYISEIIFHINCADRTAEKYI